MNCLSGRFCMAYSERMLKCIAQWNVEVDTLHVERAYVADFAWLSGREDLNALLSGALRWTLCMLRELGPTSSKCKISDIFIFYYKRSFCVI